MSISVETQVTANNPISRDAGPSLLCLLPTHSEVIQRPLLGSISASTSDHEAAMKELDPSVPPSPVRIRPAGFPRSGSMDRRINESIRFLEAVGEDPLPLSSQNEIQILDDDEVESVDDEEWDVALEIQDERVSQHRTSLQTLLSFDQRDSIISNVTHRIPCAEQGIYRHPPFQMLSQFSKGIQTSHIVIDFDYIGIGDQGLLRTRRGVDRGNYAQLHRKAWLEVSDLQHRYGKNLRLYYRHWGTLGYPTNQFFDWLDSKGDALGEPLPDLPECPRSKLDSDTVLYIADDEVTLNYGLQIQICNDGKGARGLILDVNGVPVHTGRDGWIFVLRDNKLYGSRKVTAVSQDSKQRFHHSSFFGGKAVAGAGIIVTDEQGFLTHLYPHSGHYRPGEPDVQRVLCYLYSKGVDLFTFEVDMQQLFHVCRHNQKHQPQCQLDRPSKSSQDTKDAGPIHMLCNTNYGVPLKHKKSSSLYLQNALEAAHYLSHKANCINEGVFQDIVSQEVD